MTCASCGVQVEVRWAWGKNEKSWECKKCRGKRHVRKYRRKQNLQRVGEKLKQLGETPQRETLEQVELEKKLGMTLPEIRKVVLETRADLLDVEGLFDKVGFPFPRKGGIHRSLIVVDDLLDLLEKEFMVVKRKGAEN